MRWHFRCSVTRHRHANVDTTLNVYTQVLDGSLRQAVEKVGSELFTKRGRKEQGPPRKLLRGWLANRSSIGAKRPPSLKATGSVSK